MVEWDIIGQAEETKTCFHDTLFAVNSTWSYLGLY